jgi:hypothetical protein
MDPGRRAWLQMTCRHGFPGPIHGIRQPCPRPTDIQNKQQIADPCHLFLILQPHQQITHPESL